MKARYGIVAAALALFAAAAQAKELQLASSWAAAPPKTDGTADEWSAVLRPLGDPPLVIGVRNDADYLYLCVKTSDLKTKRQLQTVGLTVWANGDGRTERAFGVRFPLRGGPQGARRRGTPAGDQPPPGDETREEGQGRRPAEFELIGPSEQDRLRVQASADEAVAVALGDDAGVTVLEFRIPLKATDVHPLAIGAAPGAVIALGLETERLKAREDVGEGDRRPGGGDGGASPPGGGPGGGYGGGRGGYGGGPGGMGGGYGGGRHGIGGGTREGARDMASPVKVWLKVSLAAPPAASAR